MSDIRLKQFWNSSRLPEFELVETHRAFFEQVEAWYGAYCAQHGAPQDAGEMELAKNLVRDWLIDQAYSFEGIEGLDAADLTNVWLNADFPEGLDADTMVNALVTWIGWLQTCGLLDESMSQRFVEQLEETRDCFRTWSTVDASQNDFVAREQTLRQFTAWLREHKQRDVFDLMTGQAVLTAAIALMGSEDGDPRTIDIGDWLERAAYIRITDAADPELRMLMDDAIQWYGVRGAIGLKERNRMHRALAQAFQQARRQQVRDGWPAVFAEAS